MYTLDSSPKKPLSPFYYPHENSFQVLLVDDDVDFCAGLEACFRLEHDFDLHITGKAEDALHMMSMNKYDILLLDVGLPDMDGRELCRMVRKQHFQMPILMITVLTGDTDTILSLEYGADDYISKPFSFSILRARLRAHLRRSRPRNSCMHKIGQCLHDGRKRCLINGDEKISLTMKESELLTKLCQSRPNAVTKKTIMQDLWGYDNTSKTHTLETHVHRLRQKFQKINGEKSIFTIAKGYSIID